MKVGTSLRFLGPGSALTLDIYKGMVEAAAPGAFIERPMGAEDPAEQGRNLIEVARAARRANTWALVTGDNHALLSIYGNAFQPVPTIARLAAETDNMPVGMVLLAPFYHPLLIAEQIGTLGCLVDAPIIVVFAAGGNEIAFNAFGYDMASRGRRTEEIVPVVRALLNGESVTASGSTFELDNASIAPVPTHPVQILLGGTNKITVERAGRLGDGWVSAQNATDAALVDHLKLYLDVAAANDRPAMPVLRRDIHIAPTDAEARAHIDPILEEGYRGVGYDELLVGSPDTVVEGLRAYEAMGFDHALLRHVTGDHDAMLASFELMGEVIEALK